jgi:hypothetical protein
MSADLLRRAATRLRESALAATPGPWVVEQQFSVDDGVLYEVVSGTDRDAVRPVPFSTVTEDAGYHSQAEADVSYAALVHPPVALALADWLDFAARASWARREAEKQVGFQPGDLTSHEEDLALAVARAVLREDG